MKFGIAVLLASLMAASLGQAQEAPSLRDKPLLLTVPRVDTETVVGQYQNILFKMAGDGRWDLISGSVANPVKIETVDTMVIGANPAQVFAKAVGYLPSACYQQGAINIRRTGDLFEVAVGQIQLQTLVACVQVVVPIKLTIPLDVYGLSAGTYRVNVNGVSGNFVLPVDNRLLGD